ncbi:unnamed protein product [Gadus morhua 'NCC']
MDVEKGRSASRTGPLSLIAQLSRQGPPKEGSSAGSAIHHAGLTHLSHALFSSVFTALEALSSTPNRSDSDARVNPSQISHDASGERLQWGSVESSMSPVVERCEGSLASWPLGLEHRQGPGGGLEKGVEVRVYPLASGLVVVVGGGR